MVKVLNMLAMVRARFVRDEDGAITVDWVVLTAGLVGLAIAITATVGGGTDAYGSLISSELANMSIKTDF